jgi:hypothetical protein
VTTRARTRPRPRLRPQGVLLILCGAALLRIALFSELYLRYVKEGLRPYLVVSGVALIALALVGMIGRDHDHDHHHDTQERRRGRG